MISLPLRKKIGLVLLNDGEGRFPRHEVWLVRRGAYGQVSGYVYVSITHKGAVPAQDRINLDEDFQGLGLGTSIVVALVGYYGHYRSDSFGQTNDQAAKVWQRLGARDGPHGSKFYLNVTHLPKPGQSDLPPTGPPPTSGP